MYIDKAMKSRRFGEWGETKAVEQLRCEGLEIVERNSRPAAYDRRLEIDIVAYDPAMDAMVFVEVKQHGSHMEGEGALRGITERKRRNLWRAFGAWRSVNKWYGHCRFDVVEVYGRPGKANPEIEHIRGVSLSARRQRADEPSAALLSPDVL